MTGRPKKEFHDYLTEYSKSHVSHEDYIKSPACAFLKYSVEAKSAIDLCIRYFPKNKNSKYQKDSLDSLQHLVVAALPAIMGHFETYQRYLFAGIFDLSVFINQFDVDLFFKLLSKETNTEVKWSRLAVHRTTGANSIGTLLSDSISGWHDPERVNKYFNCFQFGFTLFTNEDIERLKTLWQLRHSIVHTGGTLTLEDAQKVKSLRGLGGRNIAFKNNFIFEVSRKLHPLVQSATVGMGTAFKRKMLPNISKEDLEKINTFFEAKSSVSVWLKES